MFRRTLNDRLTWLTYYPVTRDRSPVQRNVMHFIHTHADCPAAARRDAPDFIVNGRAPTALLARPDLSRHLGARV